MRMTLPSAIIMAAAIWRTRILMSGSPLPDKQDRNRGQAHESLSFFVRGGWFRVSPWGVSPFDCE